MKTLWKDHLGNDPVRYARKVLKECGFWHPPVCEKTVADYLGLEIKEFSADDIPEEEGLREVIERTGAWLQRSANRKPRIYVYQNTRRERKRLHVFHESGHAILPWHEELDYLCSEKDLDPTAQKRIEREAFRCGSEFLMPREMFVEDAMSLKTGISAIEQLHDYYVSSMEATAIQYAYRHPGLCGIVMVERTENRKPDVTTKDHPSREQLNLPFKTPPIQVVLKNDKKYPIRVKYFVKSHRFPKFIRPGTGIEEGNLVFEAWDSWKPMQGEIPASVFGSSAKWAYNADCLTLGKTGKLLVLLWLPDRYLKFNFKNGLIL